ncbi:MAG: hypothetical protein WC718_05115 [Phycisphaerales bacterium]|jgi:hypothetical protein
MNSGLINRRGLAVVAAVLAVAAGSAFAGGGDHGGGRGGGHYGGGGHYSGGGRGGVSVGVNIGGGFRSGLSFGYRSSHFGLGVSIPLGGYYRDTYCAPRYYPSYCGPRYGYYSSGYYYRPTYSVIATAPLYVAPVYDVPTYTTPYTVVSQTAPVVAYPAGTIINGQQTNPSQPVYVQQSTTVNTAPQAAPVNPANGPALASSTVPEANPPSDFELGLAALQTKEPRDAVAALKSYLRSHAEDADAERLLGIALLNVGQTADAAASIRHAYKTDLKLAHEPISPSALGYTEREYRDLVSRAVIQGNRDNAAASWLFVSVLMQGDGRTDLARTMLDRAQQAGLEPEVYNALAAELPKK